MNEYQLVKRDSMFEKKAVILASGAFGTMLGKTANGLVMHGRRYEIVSVIDETKAGKDAGEVLGIGEKGIPIVANLEDSFRYNPEVLIIGVAPVGGDLPLEWKKMISTAISHKIDIISGLQFFISDSPEFKKAARKHGVNIVDFRKPPTNLKEMVFTGKIWEIDVPVVTIMSTDLCAGKNPTTIELVREAEKRGFNPGWVATGQTTMMIGADAGICVDSLIADFMSGAVEKMVLDVVNKGKNIIFVESQCSISHPWCAQESLAILNGSWPDAIILAHNPFSEKRIFFPKLDNPHPNDEIKKIETMLPETRVVGITLNGYGKNDEEVRAACETIEAETGLPATDVIRFGAENLLDAIVRHLKKMEGKKLVL